MRAWQVSAAMLEREMERQPEHNDPGPEAAMAPGDPMEAAAALAGAVAHDLGNMLTVILGNAELLADSLAARPDLAELVELILAAAQRGTELTARLDRFAQRLPEPGAPTGTAAALVAFVERLAPGLPAGVELETVFAPGLHPVRLPAASLAAVLGELAANAVEAMDGRGRLRLFAANRLAPTGEAQVRLAVEDEGRGMEAEALERQRRPRFLSGVAGHKAGLGLAFALRVAQAAGGRLFIESAAGRGTRVTLDLPASR